MWLYVFMVIVFIVFFAILTWQTNIVMVNLETRLYDETDYNFYDHYYDDENDHYCDENEHYTINNKFDENTRNDDEMTCLDLFERHYIDSLCVKFSQKVEKISKPTRQFNNYDDDDDDYNNIFVGLRPWSNVSDFGTLLHTLIGYGARFRDVDDALYLDFELAHRLNNAMHAIYKRLPVPAPIQQTPWGSPDDWYHFSVTLPECFQHICIVLRGFYDLTEITESFLYYYLPLPTLSMGWRRTGNHAIRMGLPYVYGQLLRGHTFKDILHEEHVQYVLKLIRFSPLTKVGEGIHYDYVHFDRGDVRSYKRLIDGYFTFSYYNYLFGHDTVNLNNVHKSLLLISNNRGLVNPALVSHTTRFESSLSRIMDYPDGVFAADFSKILTVRTDSYFGSLVGQTNDVAYYDADSTTVDGLHAPLWTMTRKIWSNRGRAAFEHGTQLCLESGIILTYDDENGGGVVNTAAANVSGFYPSLAYTAVCATANSGVMIMHARFDELNIEFFSYTLYHRYGMFHLYDKIKSLKLSNDARCVVLTRNTAVEPKWMVDTANALHANGVVAKHYNIINDVRALPDFNVKTIEELNLQYAEQIIDTDTINAGAGVACFGQLVQEAFNKDDTTIKRVDETHAYVINTNSNSICCVIDFPIVVLRDDETRQLSINDATSVGKAVHHLNVDKIKKALSIISLSVDDLKLSSSNMVREHDRFILSNAHGNQFKFSF